MVRPYACHQDHQATIAIKTLQRNASLVFEFGVACFQWQPWPLRASVFSIAAPPWLLSVTERRHSAPAVGAQAMSFDGPRPEPLKEKLHEVRCRRCSGTPRLAHKILNVRTGGSLRMYKCDCGEQMWLDHPE